MEVLGSVITIFGKSFGNETNSERIYAYSACILALISCAFGGYIVVKKNVIMQSDENGIVDNRGIYETQNTKIDRTI